MLGDKRDEIEITEKTVRETENSERGVKVEQAEANLRKLWTVVD